MICTSDGVSSPVAIVPILCGNVDQLILEVKSDLNLIQ